MTGRSLVMKRSVLNSEEYRNNPRSALHPEYDSIYIQEDGSANQSDYVSHKYRIFDKEKVRLMYKVTARVRISNTVDSHVPICEQCKANLGIGRDEAEGYGSSHNKPQAEQPRPAELYCINDKTYFCLDHYRDFHQSSIL